MGFKDADFAVAEAVASVAKARSIRGPSRSVWVLQAPGITRLIIDRRRN